MIARKNGWTPFISIQNHYNLIYREEEREMMQLLEEEKMVMTPYSVLAAGRLCRLPEEERIKVMKNLANEEDLSDEEFLEKLNVNEELNNGGN